MNEYQSERMTVQDTVYNRKSKESNRSVNDVISNWCHYLLNRKADSHYRK